MYTVQAINERIVKDPQGFVRQCEQEYDEKVSAAASAIIDNMASSHLVLLSGPSGSGKTTSAMRIGQKLSERGITAKIISLDNYFKDVDETTPRNEKGEFDFESPECVDFELLDEHFKLFDQGDLVRVPVFDFRHQMRSRTEYEEIQIKDRDVIIFEGIHALNDKIAGIHPEALGVFVCVMSEVDTGDGIFTGSLIRLMRRSIRDAKFRGAGPDFTLSVWDNVQDGEKKYITPFKDRARFEIDSFIPYEINMLKPFIQPVYKKLSSSENEDMRLSVLHMLEKFENTESRFVPKNSILREFIGNSVYSY